MNLKKTITCTIEYVFYGVTAVQVLLGLVWAFCQFPHLQNWQETYEYLEISNCFVMDEYVSFLYPTLLRLCNGIENIAGISFYVPVYVLQLGMAVWSAWYFARTVLKLGKINSAFGAAYLVSFPLLLQFHMSVRVESLCVSGILLLIAYLARMQRSRKKTTLPAVVTTLLLIWLLPDMAVVCAVVWLFGFIKIWCRRGNLTKEEKRKGYILFLSAFVLAFLVGISVNALVQSPGSRGRIQKTFWAASFQRVVTDYFSKSYAMWDPDVRAVYSIEAAMEMAKRSDNMMYMVGPRLEEEYGNERANELYRQMTIDCFRVRTRDVVYQIRDDLKDSLLMPFAVLWQDEGESVSRSGNGYGLFREQTPRVSMLFWNFSIVALIAVLFLGIVKAIVCRRFPVDVCYLLFAALAQCLQSVLCTGNRISYAGSTMMIAFWGIAVVTLCLQKNQTKSDNRHL